MSAPTVTHRLARHAKRVAVGKVMTEGHEPEPFEHTSWEAVCACGLVFTADDEQGASNKYLGHLPNPNTTKGATRV